MQMYHADVSPDRVSFYTHLHVRVTAQTFFKPSRL